MKTFTKYLLFCGAVLVFWACELNPTSNNIESSSSVTSGTAFNVQYLPEGDSYYGVPIDYGAPIVTVVSSKNEIEQYYGKYEINMLEKYSDSYFADNILVIVDLWEPSGSVRHEVERIDENGDIVISRLIPDSVTWDIKHWGIIIELNNNFKTKQFKAVFVTPRTFTVPPFYFDEEKYISEWNFWKSQDIKNYSFTLKGKLPYWNYSRAKVMAKDYVALIPLHGYEVEITVKNGIMYSSEYIGEAPTNSEPVYTSISDMYQNLYYQIKHGEFENMYKPHANDCLISRQYEIEYNQEFHYITRSKPIFKFKSGCTADIVIDEVTVSNFTIK